MESCMDKERMVAVMEHMDEKIIAMLQEQDEKKDEQGPDAQSEKAQELDHKWAYDLRKSLVKIDGEMISFAERSLLEEKISIPMPKAFTPMTPEMAAIKYPSERRPTLIFTNSSGSINVAINHTPTRLTDAEMEEFTAAMVQLLRKTQKLLQWHGDGVKEVNGKPIGYCEFLTPAYNVNLYNFMFFTELDGKALLCTFNCIEDEMEDWRLVARGMMEALVIHSDQKGGEEE
ncbi:hypothetical protein [Brevibacillus laterosporus]|uniref:DUF1795 domain-containing protein n=1 Tax=Brevibacillus laterosporus TaxID=1465 RepID=A0AAP3DEE6_BRELA|nr:hypothetical protein [Brevibacillus laterosporus]MBM7108046.1 hypothetical protein [Brevibacillus laterosporus]MCR8979568.1 hypothetical protein [Brevibacillus laterosporus]MCZ0806723.1 hypothetical protein [Brevibacillus laterosporus]MCZ0825753.1 hypothetical protein [Brevibacillus laterosporus]MCZ0849531.1 hypothetical protein [Brevibacillus laterosporus]